MRHVRAGAYASEAGWTRPWCFQCARRWPRPGVSRGPAQEYPTQQGDGSSAHKGANPYSTVPTESRIFTSLAGVQTPRPFPGDHPTRPRLPTQPAGRTTRSDPGRAAIGGPAAPVSGYLVSAAVESRPAWARSNQTPQRWSFSSREVHERPDGERRFAGGSPLDRIPWRLWLLVAAVDVPGGPQVVGRRDRYVDNRKRAAVNGPQANWHKARCNHSQGASYGAVGSRLAIERR
jgi:hypothetical protein